MSLAPTSVEPSPGAKFPVLVSYALVRQDLSQFERLVNHPGIEVLLDSGAFTALNTGDEVRLHDYMDFLAKWESKLFGYMALDVLGDPQGTEDNLNTMLREGFKPIPVHVRGDDGARMDYLFSVSDWVACGGLRRPHTGHSSPAYVKQKMAWAKGRNVHWLGYTRLDMVRAFKPYSIDCSNWANGGRWGKLSMYLGDFRYTERASIEQGGLDTPLCAEEVALIEELGFEIADFRNPAYHRASKDGPSPWPGSAEAKQVGTDYSTHMAFMVTAYSAVKRSREIRAKLGTREFLAAMAIGNQMDILMWMIERTQQ